MSGGVRARSSLIDAVGCAGRPGHAAPGVHERPARDVVSQHDLSDLLAQEARAADGLQLRVEVDVADRSCVAFHEGHVVAVHHGGADVLHGRGERIDSALEPQNADVVVVEGGWLWRRGTAGLTVCVAGALAHVGARAVHGRVARGHGGGPGEEARGRAG